MCNLISSLIALVYDVLFCIKYCWAVSILLLNRICFDWCFVKKNAETIKVSVITFLPAALCSFLGISDGSHHCDMCSHLFYFVFTQVLTNKMDQIPCIDNINFCTTHYRHKQQPSFKVVMIMIPQSSSSLYFLSSYLSPSSSFYLPLLLICHHIPVSPSSFYYPT